MKKQFKFSLSRLAVCTLVLISAIVFQGCNDDEDSENKFEFIFNGEAISLTGANLYMVREYDGVITGSRPGRDYSVTDGIYTNENGGYGWTLDDYEDATYFLVIQLGVPDAEELGIGGFPQFESWNDADLSSNVSYLQMKYGEGNSLHGYYTDNETEDHSPVVITGGLEDGDKMTFQFKGSLTYGHYDGTNWVYETVSGEFYYTGTVQDKRDL